MTEFTFPVELRADEARRGPGRLSGTLLTYGERASDRAEMFADGALSWPERGVVVDRQHDRRRPILRAVPEVRGRSVVIDAPIPDTAAGRDLATELREGVLTGMSVEFRAQRTEYRAGARVVTRARLLGAAVVDEPSYAGSAAELRRKARARRRPRWFA